MRGHFVKTLAYGLFVVGAAGPPGEGRMEEVADMLPAKPVGVGRSISDRAAWQTFAELDSFKKTVCETEKLGKEPIPEQPGDLYLDFSKTGNRTRWQNVAWKRRGRLRVLALAECLDNRGRFIKPLEQIIEALCKERTWVMPAHDRNLANFHGKTIDIDLASSAMGWELATIDYLLGNNLSAKTRKLIRENVRRRVLDPFMAMVEGRRKRNWWMETTSNWNAVCLAGVVGSALAIAESREERARFILAGQKYSKNFLRGFGTDGYCTEGLGYWNYGFGHYILLAEIILQATDGKLDPLKSEDVKRPATFGARIEIMNGVYPAFADCSVNVQPSQRLMAYLSRRYGLGLSQLEKEAPSADGRLFECLLHSFPNSVSGKKTVRRKATTLAARTCFDKSGILICRPGSVKSCKMGVALKGGNNAEHHNHNDVGTFIVVVGETVVLLDPGSEVYTSRTFSAKRYESKVLNSYGHPVPVVAGKLQSTGSEACGEVLKTEFADRMDTLALDISSAYAVKELKKLTRTFVYSRSGKGSLTVTDEVEFGKPEEFSTALITLGEWKKQGVDKVLVSDGDEAVLVHIEADGLDFDVKAEKIKEDVQTKRFPTRIGISLKKPVTKARVVLKVRTEN